MLEELWIDSERYRLTQWWDADALDSSSASWALRNLLRDSMAMGQVRRLVGRLDVWQRSDQEILIDLIRDVEERRWFLVPLRARRVHGAAPAPTESRPAEPAPPIVERTWFELRVLDDLEEPVPGVSIQFEIDGASLTATTDDDGVAHVAGSYGRIGKAAVASAAQAKDKVRTRWLRPHVPGPVPAGAAAQYPRDPMPQVELASEVRRTIVLVPSLLVVRLARRVVGDGNVILRAGGEEVAVPVRRTRSASNDRIELRFAIGPGTAYTLIHETRDTRRTLLSSSSLAESIAKAEESPWRAAQLPPDLELPPPPPRPPRPRGRLRVMSELRAYEEPALQSDPESEGGR